jgi:hypothetical protein
VNASDALPIDTYGDDYKLVTVGKARNKDVLRRDDHPLCERGKWTAGHDPTRLHDAGFGQPTRELCLRVLDGRWPPP